MRIALASDHAGFELKQALRERLEGMGHSVSDLGTHSTESTDYPDFAEAVGVSVTGGQADCGILVCSTGVGMSIAANKIEGIRAALVTNEDQARLTREHNDANVMALGARYVSLDEAARLSEIFLNTEFQGGRHARRIAKISRLEHPEQPAPETAH